mmetsp:Transcript_12863/g.24434  ORF Transcript_12863/g.24434 Transcript_12863/m.24434 type:complete len:230 (-) Transcript_12863:33-722(-)
MSNGKVLVDYKKNDYRGFIFLVHEEFGLLLLHCTRKKSKPPHWQLPGGHIDEDEFILAAKQSNDADEQLLLAAKAGAARELFEETGIDMQCQLDRLRPAQLKTDGNSKPSSFSLPNLYKSRLFFFLPVTDRDFPKEGGNTSPMGTIGKHLKLKMSVEHSGFIFQAEPMEAASMLQHHSGGKCSEALLMAQGKDTTSVTKQKEKTDEDRSVPADILPPPKKESGCWCFRT